MDDFYKLDGSNKNGLPIDLSIMMAIQAICSIEWINKNKRGFVWQLKV
jgi:hypothetical protein